MPWRIIADNEIDPGSPLTTSLATKLRDNANAQSNFKIEFLTGSGSWTVPAGVEGVYVIAISCRGRTLSTFSQTLQQTGTITRTSRNGNGQMVEGWLAVNPAQVINYQLANVDSDVMAERTTFFGNIFAKAGTNGTAGTSFTNSGNNGDDAVNLDNRNPSCLYIDGGDYGSITPWGNRLTGGEMLMILYRSDAT